HLIANAAIRCAPEHVFPALCMIAILFVNACSHIIVAISNSGYNPGLITSIIIFLPLGLWAYVWIIRSGAATVREAVASLIWSTLAHVVMIGGMIAAGWFRLVPEPVYLATLIGLSISPVFLCRRSVRMSPVETN
ncbi:MAG: HXXEE domain-containing protein, partial [Pseudomonadota bacterium]